MEMSSGPSASSAPLAAAASSVMPADPPELPSTPDEEGEAPPTTQRGGGNSGSSRSPSPPGARGSVKDLPDLTSRLIKEGLHEEYLRYRARYLMWRQGSAAGAVGELTELGTARRQGPEDHLQELWHPTPQKFDFFYTVSYWVAVVSLIGSLLLTFKELTPLVNLEHASNERLLNMINYAGDFFFTLSTYLNYFELINIQEGRRNFYLFPNWSGIRSRVSVESLVGVLTLFVAMLVWDISATVTLLEIECSDLATLLLKKLPVFLGGAGFFVGGICEVIHNWSRSWSDVERWIALLNVVAGGAFFLGGVVGIFDLGTEESVCFCGGMFLYTVTSTLLIVMWRSNDFGLTLLRQLNTSLRAGSPISISHTAHGLSIRHGTGLPRPAREVNGMSSPRTGGNEGNSSGRLSTRGVVFLVLYCWLFACVAMNCLAGLFMDSGFTDHILRLANGILWLFIVAIVLTIHSSLTSVPNQQPYRLAMLAMRGTLFAASVIQTLVFTRWLRHVRHPAWRGP